MEILKKLDELVESKNKFDKNYKLDDIKQDLNYLQELIQKDLYSISYDDNNIEIIECPFHNLAICQIGNFGGAR